MQLKIKEVLRVYNKLNMDTNYSSHHKVAYFKYKDKIIVKTRLSHGSGDAKAANHIRQDFRLNEEQFRDLVMCPLTKEQYIEILKTKGHI